MSDIGMPITLLANDINGDPQQLTWWYLCHEDGTPVITGEAVNDLRGSEVIVTDGMPPSVPGGTGRIVTSSGDVCCPSKFGLAWYDQTTMEEQTEGDFYSELERGFNQDR